MKLINFNMLHGEISGSHGGEYEDDCNPDDGSGKHL
jgi:hypothetical protein